MRSIYSLLRILPFALLLVACGSSAPMDASTGVHGIGGPCTNNAECRSDLACDLNSHTCQPTPHIMQDQTCSLTAECLDSPPLYCNAAGKCEPAGDVSVGGTCTDDGSCIRGAVCFRMSPGLYGTCQIPRGTTLNSPDGGAPIMGTTGTAHDQGGTCTDSLDCYAGLSCDAANHTCQTAAVIALQPSLWTGETCNDTATGTMDGGTSGVRAYFEVPAADGTPPHDFFRLPYPNDIRRDPTSGHINLTGFPHAMTPAIGFDIVDRYARASESSLDGFGTNQEVYFRFSGGFDFGSVQLGTSLRLVDLTTGHDTSSIRYGASTGARNHYLCANYITVSTEGGYPMVPGHTYAAFLTNAVTSNGQPVAADSDFMAVMGATAPSDANLARAWNAYMPFRAWLTSNSIAPNTIISAAVFTTQHATVEVPALRTVTRAQPAPMAHGFVRCDTGVTSPCDDGLTGADHVRGCIGAADPNFDELQGTIDVPIFQHGTRPYSNVGDGEIQLDASGNPIVQGTEQVCVSVTVPHGVAMPATGWPVVIYAHGTGGSFRSGITEGLAAKLANIDLGGGMSAHLAMIGYEGVMHGARRGPGVTESPNTLFFNFANPPAARDNVLQGSADVFAFVRAAETITLPMLPTASDTTSFDPTRIMFVGHSQGSTVGVPAAANEPDLAAMVFSGAGGDLRVSLTTKRHPVDIASLVPLVLQDPIAFGSDDHPALNLFQAYFERSDAVNYGNEFLSNPPSTVMMLRPILQTYGLGDTYSTEPTMQRLATSIGVPAAAPIPGMMPWPGGMGIALPITMANIHTSTGGATVGILLESDPMGLYDGHFVLFDDPVLEQHVLSFLGSTANGMTVVQ